MIGLIDFVVPALLVSVTALAALRLAPTAPPGIRFAVSLIGLCAWFVPWPSISFPPVATANPITDWVGAGGAELTSMRAGLVASTASWVPVASAPSWWWLALFAPGLVWFGADLAAYAAIVRGWQRDGRCADELGRLLPAGLRDRGPRIRIVLGSSVAVAAGFIRSTIFIGDRIGDEDALRAALTHESCHARRRDPLRLIAVTLIARLYCFNPIVLALRREAILAIEAGCDEECAQRLGRRHYRGTLARLVLEGQGHRDTALAPTFGTPGLNFTRLRLLELKPRIDARAFCAIVSVLAACIGGAAWGSAGAMSLRLGDWMEVADSASWGYDMSPAWRRFERRDNGMTRVYAADGADDGWVDFRCDGRDYFSRDDSGDSGLSFACTAIDRLTNRYVSKRTDGTGAVTFSTETVSADGETLELTADRVVAGVTTETRRTFSRLR